MKNWLSKKVPREAEGSPGRIDPCQRKGGGRVTAVFRYDNRSRYSTKLRQSGMLVDNVTGS